MTKQAISEIMFTEALNVAATQYAAEIKTLHGNISIDELNKKVKDDWAFIVRAAEKIVNAGTQIIANGLA